MQNDIDRVMKAYGGPTYKKDKGIEIGFASQKNPICFYCLVEDVMRNNKRTT
ncbi:MAG TPA: hypothetical protein VKA49_18140 [Flavitalea sp.]|nr:hypothetical protein [Flavitalea sp.]